MDAPEDEAPSYPSYSSVRRKSVLFNPHNIVGTVKGVEDWWSEEDEYCMGGGLGYWLTVSSVKRDLIQKENSDPDVQKMKLIECWMDLDAYASWHRLSRAVWRVGQTQLASLITTYEQPPTGMAFTCSNVLRAVRTVEDWWGEYDGLGYNLYISMKKRKEIQLVYSDPEEQRRQLILYWMSTDPLASWRRLITELDWMKQSPVADGIRDFAEPLATDASLTPQNIFQATSDVGYDVLRDCLEVPISVYCQINDNPSYPTEEKRREAMIVYYLNTIPLASWATLAGQLYWEEEHVSLEAVRKYLHHTTESSLNLHNLNTALETLPDDELYDFGGWLKVPWSQRHEIESQHSTERERKSALLHTYLTSHPAPSWQHVTDTLYRYGDGKLHAVLERVQTMFPTEDGPPQGTTPTDSPHPLHMSTDVTQSPPIPTTSDSSSHTPTSHPPPHSATVMSTTTQSSTAALLQSGPFLRTPEKQVEMRSSLRDKKSKIQTPGSDATAAVHISSSGDHSQLQGELGMGDLMEVTGYLKDLNKSQIYDLGLVLGLDYHHVVDLRDNCGCNQDFLDAVVVSWLQKEGRVKDVSWTAFITALQNDRLRQTGIANRIATQHGINPS